MPDAEPELRVDPLSGLRTIIAPRRAGRPHGWPGLAQPTPSDTAEDPFAEGCESRTPPEVAAVRAAGGTPDGPGWTARAVPNRYPMLVPDAKEPERAAAGDLFTARAARGAHEVIVNSSRAVATLGELEPGELQAAMGLWRERMRAHAGAACVHVMVNERPGSGASQAHTHAQLLAFDFVPALLARERERFGAYAARTMGGNLLADLLQEEVRRRERIVAIDTDAVLLAPYASRSPYAMMLVPRATPPRFTDDGPLGAALLSDGLRRLARLHGGAPPPLNIWVRTAPRGAEHFCWRIDIEPRLTNFGALELGTGLHVNVVAPEQAARELRDA